MDKFVSGLNKIMGDPSVIGASSWLQAMSWAGAGIIALIALLALGHRVSQARATFLLQLDDRWEMYKEARKEMYDLYEPRKMEVLQKHVKLEDKHRMKELRAACKDLVVDVRKTAPPTYDRFLEYLSFFETVGLVVRNGYVPLRDILQLYKGPILDIDIMFRLYIEEWQKDIDNPPGLYENVLYLTRKTRRREAIRKVIFFWR